MATPLHDSLTQFVDYAATLDGDEKGEAQVFLDRLFQAFGHGGYKEAGATLEERVRAKGRSTRFADLLWSPRVLIEMKKRGENLLFHYDQARDYWHDTYPKPRYVVLCNFDEFWIYDFFHQSEPVDILRTREIPDRYLALAFLFPEERKPQFGMDRVAVSRKAADAVAWVFNSLVKRGEDRARAQRFILQCVFCLFSEDFDLLPRGLFSELVQDCVKGMSSFDLFGNLFRQMNSREPARGGRFSQIDYFNGGLFSVIDPIDLTTDEIGYLSSAAREQWSLVQPPIFGALFEGSMDKEQRHAFGAHFTAEADIMKVVRPTIVRPWTERIEAAKTLKELTALREELLRFQVLDPACGCGNFLYVAYREMRRLEMRILLRIHSKFKKATRDKTPLQPALSLRQFHGIDILPFAVELTKLTLMLGKEQAIKEASEELEGMRENGDAIGLFEQPLPLDNLDDNILCEDSLFSEWPKADVIIGNPPFLGAKLLKPDRGPDYVKRVRRAYPGVPGMADYCVYWLRRAHDHLPICDSLNPLSGRAGLVGTQNIRNNQSRVGGLDHIVKSGTIVEAVDNQPWSGEANVNVSIVNWAKTQDAEILPPNRLLWYKQVTTGGDKKPRPRGKGSSSKEYHLLVRECSHINSALSDEIDLSGAGPLHCNTAPQRCFNGQMIGHKGFLILPDERARMLAKSPQSAQVMYPYLNGLDALTGAVLDRYVIDFEKMDQLEARAFSGAFEWVERHVLHDRKRKAQEGIGADGKMRPHHKAFLSHWWRLSFGRPEMLSVIKGLPRFLACSYVTKRPIFMFVSTTIRPSNLIQVFGFPDDYSFGILQSHFHWSWFVAKCGKLTERFRYSAESVFDTFPWPQSPTLKQARAIAKAAVELRALRRDVMEKNGWSLRDLYRTLDVPGKNPLRDAQDALDAAVRDAYGMKTSDDILTFLLNLNHDVADRESRGEPVTGPGLPPCVADPAPFITDDCIRAEEPG